MHRANEQFIAALEELDRSKADQEFLRAQLERAHADAVEERRVHAEIVARRNEEIASLRGASSSTSNINGGGRGYIKPAVRSKDDVTDEEDKDAIDGATSHLQASMWGATGATMPIQLHARPRTNSASSQGSLSPLLSSHGNHQVSSLSWSGGPVQQPSSSITEQSSRAAQKQETTHPHQPLSSSSPPVNTARARHVDLADLRRQLQELRIGTVSRGLKPALRK